MADVSQSLEHRPSQALDNKEIDSTPIDTDILSIGYHTPLGYIPVDKDLLTEVVLEERTILGAELIAETVQRVTNFLGAHSLPCELTNPILNYDKESGQFILSTDLKLAGDDSG